MRIGMMLDMYKPHISGVTNYVTLNRLALEQSGHEVTIFTFGLDRTISEEPGVFRSPGVPVAESGFYLGFRYNRAARRRLQEMDLVHVHHPFLSGNLALRYCRHRGIPIVFTNHTRYDLYAQVYLPMIPDPLSRSFLQAYMPAFCREVDLVIAPSGGIERVLRDLGVDAPMEVIPNGVDLAPFAGEVHRVDRARLGFEHDDAIVVYVGRMGAEKNLSFLLRTFAGARTAVSSAKLLLVGGGPEAENLRGLAQALGLGDAVRFTGPVPYEEVPGILASCDVFATASVTEVHPLSVIEAMASGLPVVGIVGPGLSDTVEDGVDGLLTRNDAAAFSAQLTRLLLDAALRKRMGEAARRKSRQYSILDTSARVVEAYRRVLATPRRLDSGRWDRSWRELLDRLT
jgi:1,2-diacylglycerol 3-alpha-glucosyltransferase